MTAIRSQAGNPQQQYDAANSQLKQMQKQQWDAIGPRGLVQHVLPNQHDNGFVKTMKVAGLTALGLAAVGGAITGAGALFHSDGLIAAARFPVAGAATVVGGFLVVGMVAAFGPMVGADPLSKDLPPTPAIKDQQKVVDELYKHTPDQVMRSQIDATRTAEKHAVMKTKVGEMVATWDHNHDGAINISQHQAMTADERAVRANGTGGPATDGNQAIDTAMSDFRNADTNHDNRVVADELVKYFEGQDEHLSWGANPDPKLNLHEFGSYRDFPHDEG